MDLGIRAQQHLAVDQELSAPGNGVSHWLTFGRHPHRSDYGTEDFTKTSSVKCPNESCTVQCFPKSPLLCGLQSLLASGHPQRLSRRGGNGTTAPSAIAQEVQSRLVQTRLNRFLHPEMSGGVPQDDDLCSCESTKKVKSNGIWQFLGQ